MTNGVTHAGPGTTDTAAAGPPPAPTGHHAGIRERLVAKVVSVTRSGEPNSGWYVRTGDGSAVDPSGDDLQDVDMDDLLGDRFRLAVRSVAEVGEGAPEQDRGARLTELARVFRQKVTAEPDDHR